MFEQFLDVEPEHQIKSSFVRLEHDTYGMQFVQLGQELKDEFDV